MKDNPGLARALEDDLSGIEGVRHVEVNTWAGSVLVVYEVAEQMSRQSWESLSDALGPLLPKEDAKDLPARLARSANGESPPAAPLEARISGFLGTLNGGVARVTGGVDLKLLLPLALFALGIRGLIVSDKVRFPVWYDFLWFSFGTFLALNPLSEGQTVEP